MLTSCAREVTEIEDIEHLFINDPMYMRFNSVIWIDMESMFRILLHEKSHDHGDVTDPKLHSSMDYHRRDLEDFERAINLVEVSYSYHSREDAISRHKQFIRAIQAHICQWGNLDGQDRDGLSLFLLGGNTNDHINPYDSESSSMMRRFLDSTTTFDDNTDEIIELKSEENEDSKMNGVHTDHVLDFVKENNTTNVASNYPTRTGYEGANWGLEGCDSNAKSFFSRNKQRGSRWLDILKVFNKYWSIYGSRMTKSFTKRRKDGELEDEFKHRPASSYSSYVDICQAEQLNLQTPFRGHGLYSNVLTACSRVGISNVRCKRLQYFIQVNRRSIWLILVVFVTLIILGKDWYFLFVSWHSEYSEIIGQRELRVRSCAGILPTSATFLHYSRFSLCRDQRSFGQGKQSHVVTNYEAHGWWNCLF
ncbi:hypothetical protein MKW92_014001 [Papaver armeniacum]|nr:hypothetical protein MKW92_014001 [Papaver armeniacum]